MSNIWDLQGDMSVLLRSHDLLRSDKAIASLRDAGKHLVSS